MSASKFDKVADEFCARAAVEGNRRDWPGRDVFIERCKERVIKSLESAERHAKKGGKVK